MPRAVSDSPSAVRFSSASPSSPPLMSPQGTSCVALEAVSFGNEAVRGRSAYLIKLSSSELEALIGGAWPGAGAFLPPVKT